MQYFRPIPSTLVYIIDNLDSQWAAVFLARDDQRQLEIAVERGPGCRLPHSTTYSPAEGDGIDLGHGRGHHLGVTNRTLLHGFFDIRTGCLNLKTAALSKRLRPDW